MTTRWFVVEGDDHEKRIVEAEGPEEANLVAQADFEAQYGEPYSIDLLTVLGDYDSEEAALLEHDDAT